MSDTPDIKLLLDAILETRDGVPILGKNARNEFQAYNFVSIDQFYEKVKPVANKAGLIWRARMVEWKVNLDLGKHGSVEALVAFDMYHKSGAAIENYMAVPIINSLVGAQTTGQVMSYAEKVFMRAAFGVATGEADADQTDQAAFSRENKPRAAHNNEQGRGNTDARLGGDSGVASVQSGVHTPSAPKLEIPHDPITGEVQEGIPETEGLASRANPDQLPIFDTKKFSDKNVELVVKVFETWMDKPKTVKALRNWFAENVPTIEKIKAIDPAAAADLTEKFKLQAAKLK